MSATLHQRSAELFVAALGVQPADRARFLDEHCGGDRTIRDEVEALLRADTEAGQFLEPPRPGGGAGEEPAAAANLMGRCIDGYRVTRWVASGGMGTVYEAIQQPLGRTVALKLLKAGVVDTASLRRFEHEARLLARLRHPGIAQILEAGIFDDREGWIGPAGSRAPFIAMEFVPNAATVTEYARRRGLATIQRLELMAAVCDAVHHGHQQGITHRDLKPANILVVDQSLEEGGASQSDALPQPKIIDFGVARTSRAESGLTTMQTAVGQLIGTLAYMSPEQCVADPNDVDIRSDIYSLGVVMYEILCGRLPYEVPSENPLEAVRVIRERQATRLSSINSDFRGDLEAIVQKAMEKDRLRRYQSVDDLASDLRRFIQRQPVTARPPSVTYQLRSFARRNKALVGGVIAAFTLLAAGVLATSWGLVRARRAERLADARRLSAEREAYVADIAAADAAIEAQDGGNATARLQEAPAVLRGWEWYHLAQRADRSESRLDGPASPVRMAASRDGKAIIGLFGDGTLRRWDVADRLVRWSVPQAVPSGMDGTSGLVRLSPDGKQIAAIVQGDVWTFDAESGHPGRRLGLATSSRDALNIAFHPDSRHLAVSSTRDVSVWDLSLGVEEKRLEMNGYVFGLAISRDGRLLAHSDQQGVAIRDSLSLAPVNSIPVTNGAAYLEFSPDGAFLAVSNEAKATILDIASRRPVAMLGGHRQRIEALAWRSDGRLLASGSIDRTIRLWDIPSGAPGEALLGHGGRIVDLAFIDDGSRIASASNDGTLRLWDAHPKPDVAILDAGNSFVAPPISWSNDGKRLLSSSGARLVLWGAATLRPLLDIPRPRADLAFRHAVLSPDGESIATSNFSSHCTLISSRDGQAIWTASEPDDSVPCYAFSPDGRTLASPAPDHSLCIRDTQSGRVVRRLPGQAGKILFICFSPDGGKLATTDMDGCLRVWSLTQRGSDAELWHQEHLHGIACAAWSPDGSRLATVSTDETATVWDASCGRRIMTLTGLQDGGWSIAFSPDGRRIATGSKDRLIRIWDPDDGRELLKLRGHTGTIMALSWSPDGRRLTSGSYDGTVRIWEAAAPKGRP